MPTVPTVDLYVDDTGSRHPDHADAMHRRDGMDAFALGGIIVDSERAPEIHELHRSLVEKLGLTTPLHSHKIRTRAKQFAWLGEDADRAARFYANLNDLMVRMPAHGVAPLRWTVSGFRSCGDVSTLWATVRLAPILARVSTATIAGYRRAGGRHAGRARSDW